MPPPIPVTLVEYNADWPGMAAGYAACLKQALGSSLVIVHHIGSTSVPGLGAKPIIDLMPLVTDLAVLDQQRQHVEALGYVWHGELGISGRRYCTLSDKIGIRLGQLHFFKADSPDVRRHIAFRDYLRTHPEAARAYEHEKRRARDLHPDDSHAYTDKKAAWIQVIEAKALIWFETREPDLRRNST
ncbi:GrpB family protein [Methylocapsa acidiphila]|uniref:GrpB family protein n=1 Tax=Methylocapsa acidiphila TaxID=133552 RepID=UPI0003FA5AAD|nr:GrpB family protein [Methylocapsa acidiphila]